MADKLTDIEGIGPAFAAAFEKLGIHDTDGFLAAARTPAGRAKLAADLPARPDLVLKWVNHADLMRVKGIGGQYAELLEAAGVDTVKELRRRNAENLTARLAEVNAEKKLSGNTPALKQVTAWIEQAGTLDSVLEY